jgi:threonine/homoserine/homoserine lactone efflux protein
VSDLVAALAPEMLGLVVTPAAIIGSLILLGSSRPLRNVACFAAVSLGVYVVVSLLALVLGRAAGATTEHQSTARGWVSVVVGALFVLAGVAQWIRGERVARHAVMQAAVQRHQPQLSTALSEARTAVAEGEGAAAVAAAQDGDAPGWVRTLSDPSLRQVGVISLVLAVVNPNVAILVSGLTIVNTADVSGGQRATGIVLLLVASMVDFVVPVLLYLVTGESGRRLLRRATGWLIRHNQVIGICVLLAFGLLFVGRGLGQVLG